MRGAAAARCATWLVMIAGVCGPVPAAAEILDRIEIVPAGSEVEIHIFFTTPVVYRSHFPVRRSEFVRIDVLLPQLDDRRELRRERLTSPPSDLVPPFIVSFPDRRRNGGRSLSVNFRKPVAFTVRGSRDRTSLVIAVPVLRPPTPSQALPHSRGAPSPPPAAAEPPAEPRAKSSPPPAAARGRGVTLIERIGVARTQSSTEIRIHFRRPVGYLYHFPKTHSDFVRVWLVVPKDKRLLRLRRQAASSPPGDDAPGFSVLFPEQEDGRTKSLAMAFGESVVFSLRSSRDKRVLIVSVPRPARSSDGERTPSGEASRGTSRAEVQKAAEELMTNARGALRAGANETATQLLNALLNLPPNQHSQEAQELVGVARERSGELAEAFMEYELYLKLYPDSEGASRVRQRLAALKRLAPRPLPRAARGAPRKPETSMFGSMSQYYFYGQSRSETTFSDGGEVTTLNQNVVDQSLFVSTVNLTGRSRTAAYDNRVVLRGTNNLDTQAGRGEREEFRLRRAYVRHENKERLYLAQVGRQYGSFGGILTPYDGGWLRYGLLPWLHVNAVGGLPQKNSTETNLSLDFGHYFYGGDLSIEPSGSGWSGDGYFLSQMVDGVVDRRAVGGELRYAGGRLSAFSLVDYDISYDQLNIATVNGSWQSEGGTLVTALVDVRKTPSLQTTNGLLATGQTSVEDALRTTTEDTLRRQALALTADSVIVQLGLTYPWNTRWQLGGDLNVTRISGTEAAGDFPALPSTGAIRTYTLRALGRDIGFRDHTVSVITSYTDSPIFDGQTVVLNSLSRFGDSWRFDATVTLYHQVDDNASRLIRVTPSARLGYRWGDHLTVEVEGGLERADTNGPMQRDLMLRQFFSAGLVWEP